jgi:hypothetical protein
MKELIEAWISNQDYQTGVELYRRFGNSAFMLKMFENGESNFNRDKLLQSLTELITNEQLKPVLIEKERVHEVLEDDSKRLSDRSTAPDEIKDAIKRRKYLYATAREKHGNLKLLSKKGDGDQEERRLIAMVILDKFDDINKIWNKTSFYDNRGRLPVTKVNLEVDFSGADTVELNKKWLTNYKYVKRAVKNPKQKKQVSERTILNQQIENYLTTQDAFFHLGLKMPEIRNEETEAQ